MTTEQVRLRRPRPRSGRSAARIDTGRTLALVDALLDRHATVGLSVGVVRPDGRALIRNRGFADVAAGVPVTERTRFRIASVTKLFTAIAVMQLVERGLVDLDTPANEYLRSYRLAAARPGLRQPTVRHLLTHTSGIPDVVYVADLLHPGWGAFAARPAAFSVPVGERLPSLADYYGGALRHVVEPGRHFAYSNHGFATLGQVITDVTGVTLHRYLRDKVLAPLGMTESGLAPMLHGEPLAIGYELRAGGAKPVQPRDWITAGGGGIVSTPLDLARFVAALLGGGANSHGRVLAPSSLAKMFEPSFQPDSRVPGIGLAFFRSEVDGHRLVEHDGRLPGFNSQVIVAPDDGVGVIALTNGAAGATGWMPQELTALIGRIIGAAETEAAMGPPDRDVARTVAGRYCLAPRVSDLRGRLMMGGGVALTERRGRPTARLLLPVPALLRGVPMQPSRDDPYLFRLDLSRFGMPVVRVAFARDPIDGVWVMHTDLACLSLYRQPGWRLDRTWRALSVILLVAVVVSALRRLRR